MDHFQTVTNKVFDHIRYNKLPLRYKINGDYIEIDCSGWDINEIDDMIIITGGKLEGFTVRIKNEGNIN